MVRQPTNAEDLRFAREVVDMLEEVLVPINADDQYRTLTCAPFLEWIRRTFRPEDIFTEHQLDLYIGRRTGERP